MQELSLSEYINLDKKISSYPARNKHMKKIKRSIEENYSPTYLSQSDFDNGTFIIDKPGNYILTEDITFNPNQDNDWMPKSDQIQYSDHAFVLGFFACIMVKTYKFIINLNGKNI